MKMKLFTVFAAWSAAFIASAQAPTGPAVKSAPPPAVPIAAAKASAAALSAQAKATDAALAPAPKVAEAPVPKAVAAPAPQAVESPVTQAVAKESAKTAEKVAPAANPVGQTDEIDLEEIDDAALADKQPTVKKADVPAPAKAAETKSAAVGEGEVADLAYDENALVDITCEDATLADILRQFRKAIGANIISSDSSNLQQRVSVNLRHVPWYQSLQSILNTRNFRLEDRNGIYFVSEDKQAIPVFTRTYQLNHASSEELAKLFNDSYGVKAADGKVLQSVASAFPGANTLVVTASEKVLADCEAIIKSVDKAVAQIYIEARFLELSNEALHKLGVQWNQLESWGASVKDLHGGLGFSHDRNRNRTWNTGRDRSASSTQTKQDQSQGTSSSSKGSSSAAGDTSSFSTSTGDSSGTESSSSSVLDSVSKVTDTFSRSVGGTADAAFSRSFSGQLSADDFSLAMSAFEQIGDGKVFSNPRVVVSNGKEAKVDMTTKFPYVKITSQRNTQNTTSYLDMSAELQQIPGTDKELFSGSTFFSWGITLSVKPRISPDGLISVEIIPTISDLKEYYSLAQSDTDFGRFPVIEMKRLTTDFTMKDGATAVIGGLSKTTEEDVDSGIPYLRQIPWVGQKLFGWKSRQKVQKEIIVLVTIGIANPAELDRAIGLPTNAVLGREYVEGRRFEPGDRDGGVNALMAFDMRPVEEQRANVPQPSGTVTITPVKKVTVKGRPNPPAKSDSAEKAEGNVK